MSKIVSGIGDAIGGVVKGVVNVVSDVAKGVGNFVNDIAKSDLGKALIIAGAVYFGGAALAGGFGSSAAGGSFLSGMGAGVGSAASTLSGAWSSALGGEFASAASSIGNAFGTAGTAGEMAASTLAPAVANAAPAFLPEAGQAASSMASTGANAAPTFLPEAGQAASTMANSGAKVATDAAAKSWWASQDPIVKYGLIQSGMQIGGGLISGAGQAKAAQEARDYDVAKYNANVGGALNLGAPPVGYYPPVGNYGMPPAPMGIASRYMQPRPA
jgi:hypothetical protein